MPSKCFDLALQMNPQSFETYSNKGQESVIKFLKNFMMPYKCMIRKLRFIHDVYQHILIKVNSLYYIKELY